MPRERKKDKDPSKGGRPLKYNEEMLAKAWEYVKIVENPDETPTLVGLALFLGIVEDTLHDWKANFPEFSVPCRIVKALQHERLVSKGLTGDYNGSLVQFLLKNNHGYKDKSEVVQKRIEVEGFEIEEPQDES